MPIIRPKIQILDTEHKKLILEEAKSILETQGIFIENQEAVDMFNQHGLNHKELRYYIPSDLVEKCLDSVPNKITLFDRDGSENITLEEDQVHFEGIEKCDLNYWVKAACVSPCYALGP